MDIDEMINGLIVREGGYSNHQADTGGATRWGITEAVARNHGYRGDMRDLPREDAVAIYKRLYWLRPGFDKVAELAPQLAEEMFDIGVNMGPGVAAGFLQRVLNALNREARDYPDLVLDRKVGVKTCNALSAFLEKRGSKGEAVLIRAIDSLQAEKYIHHAEKRPANQAFLYGWLAHRTG